MSYTQQDNIRAKSELIYILTSQGYAPYARLLRKFFVFLTDDENTIAGMLPDKFIIVMNPAKFNYSMKMASMLIRHEILHQFLDHALRSIRHLGELEYNNRTHTVHDRLNRAQDYEISELGYTESDKELTRILGGLLLCDDHPEWDGLTFEEIYDRLKDQEPENPEGPEGPEGPEQPPEQHDPDFIDGYKDAIEKWKENKDVFNGLGAPMYD